MSVENEEYGESVRPTDAQEYRNAMRFYARTRISLDRSLRRTQLRADISDQYRDIIVEIIRGRISRAEGSTLEYVYGTADYVGQRGAAKDVVMHLDCSLGVINRETTKQDEVKVFRKFGRFMNKSLASVGD